MKSRKRLLAASSALVVLQLQAAVRSSVPVEQIEAYENTPSGNYEPYAPLNFNGSLSYTVSGNGNGGQENGITFHADPDSGIQQTASGHAQTVGIDIYGSGSSPAYPFVTDVYAEAADVFLSSVLKPLGTTGNGPVPGSFAGGSLVINNSYVGAENSTAAYLDDNRRLDYMIDQADVVWVGAAVTGGAGLSQAQYLAWSNFNGLAVSGIQNSQQSFSPAGSPGKQHADLGIYFADGSFAAADVSGYAAALIGSAQGAGQLDAQHGVVTRSLLMSGADRLSSGSAATANNLDPVYGAGLPDYTTSQAAELSGETTLHSVTAGSNISGGLAVNQLGWSYGTVGGTSGAAAQEAIVFSSAGNISGLTASLNWNVTSNASGGNLNTSNGGLRFPNLKLELRPVTYNAGSGQYVLSSSSSDLLSSTLNGDNVQYLYGTSAIPAGKYAFLITGDPSLSAAVGFSYVLDGSFTSRWNSSTGGSWSSSGNWQNSVPNGRGAQVTFGSSPGLVSPGTVTLDGTRIVGQLFFNSTAGYTISNGSGGTLVVDDTGDIAGAAAPQFNVSAGAQTISAPITIDNGVNIYVASAASLTLSGALSGSGYLNKFGGGSETVSNSLSASVFEFNGGNSTITPSGSLNTGLVYLNPGGTLTFAAGSSSGIFVRNIGVGVTIQGGTLVAAVAGSAGTRQLVNLGSTLSFAGTSGSWVGKLDLTNNDLIDPGGSLASVTNQVLEGYNGGRWNGGGGILSSTAAAISSRLTAIGVIQNNQSGSALYTAWSPFDGVTPGAGDILLKYTYYGDANLDGKVDGTDYSRIDNGYLAHLTGWYNGDFNYDSVIDGSDYTLIDNAYNSQGAAITSQIAGIDAIATSQIADKSTAVPEPAGFMALGLGVSVLLGRRTRVST
jgi:hypothetical protein